MFIIILRERERERKEFDKIRGEIKTYICKFDTFFYYTLINEFKFIFLPPYILNVIIILQIKVFVRYRKKKRC